MFGRLAPSPTIEGANENLRAIKTRLDPQYPTFKQAWGVLVQPVTDGLGMATHTPMILLLGAGPSCY